MGLALKGYSVGWGAAGRLRGVPYRASQWSATTPAPWTQAAITV